MTPDDKTKLDSIGALALSTRPTLDFSFDLAVKCIEDGVPGDFVECGVYAGSQCAAMALAIQSYIQRWQGKYPPGLCACLHICFEPRNEPCGHCSKIENRVATRKIHLFDSFEGIPQAGPHDDPRLSGQSKCTLEQCFGYMTKTWKIEAERLIFHRGWFKDTIPDAQIERIAILRLDGDLYESTKTALEGLFPAVVDGGYCIVDDYALNGCRMAVREYLAHNNLKPTIHPIEGGGGPVWFRKE